MNADTLLARLHNVRNSGANAWRADCPNGHTKSRGSLAITEGSDGTLLLHCFACSDVQGILGAIGLELADLFPERIKDPTPEGRRTAREAFKRSAWQAALGVLSRETTVVTAAAGMLRQHLQLTTEDDARLTLAMTRIDRAREVLT